MTTSDSASIPIFHAATEVSHASARDKMPTDASGIPDELQIAGLRPQSTTSSLGKRMSARKPL
jgi:hypothetical protein